MIHGYFSIVLHAHLPYVRHREAQRLEERWLFEAISETYIPLLWILEEQQQEKALTISFSTPLMEMLADPLLQRRYLQYLENKESLLNKEVLFVKKKEEIQLVEFYNHRVKKLKHTFLLWDQNLLKGFRHYAKEEKLVCICSSATHAFLPYLLTNEGVKAQILHGLETFNRHFGYKPRGFWLPECAYTPGIDRILFEEGIRYTFVDEQAIKYADPKPLKGTGAPIFSPHGIMLFPRNCKMSSKVWSSLDGYPGDFDYREFYRDVAYEREWEYIKPYMHPNGFRVDTGLKYHRVTGLTENKQFYIRENAVNKVDEHSEDFIKTLKEEFQCNHCHGSPPYLIVTPFDAELFGHWWFEGPDWLKRLIDEGSKEVNFITPEQYMDAHYQEIETAHVTFNTWGRHGYGEVWLNEKNGWMYRHLHRIEKELIHFVTKYKGMSREVDSFLKQMVREWMLATSSDWAFIIEEETASQYARNRIEEHLSRFEKLKLHVLYGELNKDILIVYEADYPFIKEIILEVFVSNHDQYYVKKTEQLQPQQGKKTILMLAWEYPPMIVGGLSRHVFDLSKSLSSNGHEVHVITTAVKGCPDYEVHYGVNVHRVTSLQPNASDFYHWVGSLNIAFTDYVMSLSRKIEFDIVHAHDWLVCVAAKALKHQLNIPLVSTIHATEHGRNGGIHTQLQRDISHKEWELCYEAHKVIVCSNYMKREVIEVFQLPNAKIEIIPNGVDIEMISGENSKWKHKFGKESDIYIFSVGRIVEEKGFQTIINAAPLILEKHPNVKFIIAGKGPLLDHYLEQVKIKKLQNSLFFIGFINDPLRNEILNGCDICLFPSYYEPFGIVALEGMIAGKPTIVSDTGGLGEIITHRKTGLKIFPNDVHSLTTQVISCLEDHSLSKLIAENGKKLAEEKYNWNSLAIKTVAVYDDACLMKKESIGG